MTINLTTEQRSLSCSNHNTCKVMYDASKVVAEVHLAGFSKDLEAVCLIESAETLDRHEGHH